MLIDLPEDILLHIITYLAGENYRALDATCRAFDACHECDTIRCGRPRNRNDSPGSHFRQGLLWRAAEKFYRLPLWTSKSRKMECTLGLGPAKSWTRTYPVAQVWYWRHWEGDTFPSGCCCNYSRFESIGLFIGYPTVIVGELPPPDVPKLPPPDVPYRRRLKYPMGPAPCHCQPSGFGSSHEKVYL